MRVTLDPSKTGREAQALERLLQRLIVGQDEAVQHIVNVYQMYLTGLGVPGRPIGNFLFLGRLDLERHALWRRRPKG